MKKWLDKYETPKAQDGTILPRNLDPKYKAAIAEDKERLRQSQATVKSTKPFEVKDTRSFFNDRRAKERADAAWNAIQKGTALAAYFPHPLVSNSAVAINSGMGLIDAYYAHQEGDIQNRNINLVGAAPVPSYAVAKQLAEGLGKKHQAKANRFALMMLGLDAFGTAADLTNNFRYDKKQNGGAIEGTMGGLTDVGFNYNGAWGGQFAMGGNLPGATGMMYARTGAPSEGKYAKKTMASAQDGKSLFAGKFSKFKKSLPPNLALTPNRHYDMRYSWRHSGKPKDFAEAQSMEEPMFSLEDDGLFHGTSVQGNTGRFLKPKDHPSLQMELDWYYGNTPEAIDFRSKNNLNKRGKYYRYVPKGQNGAEMKFYQEGLDFKPKTISQDGSEIVKDDMGYWNPDNWGKPVEIDSNIITMEGVDVPLIGISDTGDVQYMEPGEEYVFDGETVTEYPVARNGINQADAQPIKKLDQSLNFTNYNKPTKGGWLNKYK